MELTLPQVTVSTHIGLPSFQGSGMLLVIYTLVTDEVTGDLNTTFLRAAKTAFKRSRRGPGLVMLVIAVPYHRAAHAVLMRSAWLAA